MSLCVCPHCGKKYSFWKIYWKLNSSHFGPIHCKKCGKKMLPSHKKYSFFQRVSYSFLWMLFPGLLILLTATGEMHFLLAIFFVILYHFICMYGIITLWNYKK